MEKHPTLEFTDAEHPPDYRQKLAELLHIYPQVHIQPAVRDAWIEELDWLRVQYNTPGTHGYHDYHNADHGLDDLVRSFAIMEIIERHVPITSSTYVATGTAAVLHDKYISRIDNMTGEQRSALYAMETGAKLLPEQKDIRRVVEAIMVTTATFDKLGVHQPYLLAGSKTPEKFALALADVGAILFEGKQRMIQDVVNLALEQFRTQKANSSLTVIDHIMTLLESQPQFIKERLADLEQATDYYFADHGQAVVAAIRSDLYERITPNLTDIQPVLSVIENKRSLPIMFNTLRRLASDDELLGDEHSSRSLQRKLGETLDSMMTL